MAIQTSPLFKGFRGSVNRRLLFRQCGGKTVLSRFPDRSRVVYSERQKQAQKRFSDAVDFARVVINEPGLRDMYSIKASLLGFRSSWNLAIAEYMSERPLTVKKKKIRFDKSILVRSLRWNIPVKLYKFEEEPPQSPLKAPGRLKSGTVHRRLYRATSPVPAGKPDGTSYRNILNPKLKESQLRKPS